VRQTKRSGLITAEIEKIVRRGAAHLGEALWAYFPTATKEITERNISLHVGRAFADSEYNVFAEAPWNGGGDQHIDLIALDMARGIQVAVESKRLYGAEKLTEMHRDVDRIFDFKVDEDSAGEHPPWQRFGVLLATTWREDFASWWSAMNCNSPTDHEVFKLFYEDHRLQDGTFGSCVLRAFEEDKELAKTKFHYFLYGVFEV